jgi:thymidylate kinase
MTHRPLIVEFAGLPGAGKTSAIDLLDRYFRREGWRVRIIMEGAQACPISQEHRLPFAAWAAHRMANLLLEETYAPRPVDLLLVDRGIFDAQVFLRLLHLESRITDEQSRTLLNYLRLPFWAGLTDLIFLLDISPAESLRRRSADTLTERPGPILNGRTLELLADCYEEAAAYHQHAALGPDLRRVSTADLAPRGVAEAILPVIQAALTAAASA